MGGLMELKPGSMGVTQEDRGDRWIDYGRNKSNLEEFSRRVDDISFSREVRNIGLASESYGKLNTVRQFVKRQLWHDLRKKAGRGI